MPNVEQTEQLKKWLQPDVIVELRKRVLGPLDLLRLKEQLDSWRRGQARHQDTADVTIEHRIPFKPETWEALSHLAGQLETQGARVTPEQVAAWLVESGLARMANDAQDTQAPGR